MNKVVVLVVVIGMASASNATYTIVQERNKVDIIADGTMQYYIVGITDGSTDGGTMLYQGILAWIYDVHDREDIVAAAEQVIADSLKELWLLDFHDPMGLLPRAGEKVATFDGVQLPYTFWLLSYPELNEIDSITVPEPMTIALFAIGGLFIHRIRSTAFR